MIHPQHWLVTADSRRAVLFIARRLAGGGLHLDQLRAIANPHENEHEHHRPTLAGGAERPGSVLRSGARAAPHAIAAGHTDEEEHGRFAREVGDWLVQARKDLGAGRMAVFAPPRFLGLLRERAGNADLDFHNGELCGLAPQELAAHAAVRNALGLGT